MNLSDLGYEEFFTGEHHTGDNVDHAPARVVGVHKDSYLIHDGRRNRLVSLFESGRTTGCFGDYLDDKLPSAGTSKIWDGKSEEASEIAEAENREIELYAKYKAYYSYGVYVARKLD